MKVKLYKGPFSGKVYETDGRNEIIIRGPKPMNRRQRWEWESEQYRNGAFNLRPVPTVEARYQMVITLACTATGYQNIPSIHPDGSYYYKYVEGSKREY